jgi:hypothetical protein
MAACGACSSSTASRTSSTRGYAGLSGMGRRALRRGRYDLTRRRCGRAAGFAAGLALVLTPITVAIARHNNLDALLTLGYDLQGLADELR